MTEAEWLVCEKPREMFDYLGERATDTVKRHWVEACRALVPEYTTWTSLDDVSNLNDCAQSWCDVRRWTPHVPIATRANLLREIAGNPFRSVSLPKTRRCQKCGWDGNGPNKKYCDRPQTFDGKVPHLWKKQYPWLTLTVVDLARATVEQRGRMCQVCKGEGDLRDQVYEFVDCNPCQGTGRIGVELDPVRMLVLADALEEAGCNSEEVLRHLRGQEKCCVCAGMGTVSQTIQCDPDQRPWRTDTVVEMCTACGGDERDQEPGSGWVPLRQPHVAGCWALRLLLEVTL